MTKEKALLIDIHKKDMKLIEKIKKKRKKFPINKFVIRS